ncbi:MAG TPA: hypothetical protein VE053_12795 [Allosphingosinicella sp.]|nr:hypothetical protein [Allosphingosinicella sp.]
MHDLARLSAIALVALSTPACAEEAGSGPELRAAAAPRPAGSATRQPSPGGGVAKLPFARGKTFRTLDEYLAHLERQGAIDLPYWRQVEPGLYERVTTRVPAGPPERATRAELMRRFGFTR